MSMHIVSVTQLSSLSDPQRPSLDREARVLMVDQGSDIGVGLLLMLRIWGHSVSVARNWRHGLLQARDLDPHVVLVNLDLLLPGTLAAAMRALRAVDARTNILVALKDGMPYFVDEAGNSPRLRLATTPALKAAIRSLVESAEAPAPTAEPGRAIPIRTVTSAAG